MKYFYMLPNNKGGALLIKENDFPINAYALHLGVDLRGKELPHVTITYPKSLTIGDWPCVGDNVVSERFKTLIESMNCDGIQFLPFTAMREDGQESCTLYLINLLPMATEALDIEHSKKFNTWKEGDLLIIPAVSESKLNGLDVFALPYCGGKMYISERLVKEIKKNKLTGMVFQQIRNAYDEIAVSDKKFKGQIDKNNNATKNLGNVSFDVWIDNVVADIPQMEIEAFCFNIYEDASDKYSVEIVACDEYDKDDDDWACEEVYASRDAFANYTFEAKNWKNAQSIIAKEIKKYLADGKKASILKNAKAVACGLVDGDLKTVYKNKQ